MPESVLRARFCRHGGPDRSQPHSADKRMGGLGSAMGPLFSLAGPTSRQFRIPRIGLPKSRQASSSSIRRALTTAALSMRSCSGRMRSSPTSLPPMAVTLSSRIGFADTGSGSGATQRSTQKRSRRPPIKWAACAWARPCNSAAGCTDLDRNCCVRCLFPPLTSANGLSNCFASLTPWPTARSCATLPIPSSFGTQRRSLDDRGKTPAIGGAASVSYPPPTG